MCIGHVGLDFKVKRHHWFFFFQGYGEHQDLHSFPTRRSSDLSSARLRLVMSSCVPQICTKDPSSTIPVRLKIDRKSTRLNSSPQSNLVCRLLLEKKKKLHPDHARARSEYREHSFFLIHYETEV